MAKPPFGGSKLRVCEFIVKELKNKDFKVIQPQVASYHDETFWWTVKIVIIGKLDSNVGIIKKREIGFVIVSETLKKKLKMENMFMEKVFEKKRPAEN